MTYLNSTPQTERASAPQITDMKPVDIPADIVGQAPASHDAAACLPAIRPSAALRVLMAIALWLAGMAATCRSQAESDRMFRSPRIRAALIALSLGVKFLPGTAAEKNRIMRVLLGTAKAQTAVKFKRLYKAYLVWRQRKCWAWGGGFMSGLLTVMTGTLTKAVDAYSFDALIPD